eukprot:12021906-Alexandrium_andersonii.AAC.1
MARRGRPPTTCSTAASTRAPSSRSGRPCSARTPRAAKPTTSSTASGPRALGSGAPRTAMR